MSDIFIQKRVKKQLDMLTCPLLKNLILFALPLALCGILQQLFSSADAAIVNLYNGTSAQAAVNSNSSLINLFINLFTGLSVGVTVTITEYIGKNRTDDIHSITLTATVIALVSGVVLLVVGLFAAEPMLRLMDTDVEVLPLATEYLKIYFMGMPFVMLYNFGAAILRSIGDTKRPLYALVAAGVLNVGLNFLFVAAFKMSVAGVGYATVISDALSAAIVYIAIMREKNLKIRYKKNEDRSRVRSKYIGKIFKIGLPAGLQGVVFSISNVFIQSKINYFGKNAMAGNGDCLYFESYVYFFINAFAQATVTFIGQNFAAGKYDRCKKIFWYSMACSVAISAVLSLALTLLARWVIRIYTSDPEVIEYAVIRFRYVVIFEMIACGYEIAGAALRAMGHSLFPAIATVMGACVLRLIWIYTVFNVYKEFWVLLIIYPISWAITGVVMIIAYFIMAKKEYVICLSTSNVAAETSGVTENAQEVVQSKTPEINDFTPEFDEQINVPDVWS